MALLSHAVSRRRFDSQLLSIYGDAVPQALHAATDILPVRLIADAFAHDFQCFRDNDKCLRIDPADNFLESREFRKCYYRVQDV